MGGSLPAAQSQGSLVDYSIWSDGSLTESSYFILWRLCVVCPGLFGSAALGLSDSIHGRAGLHQRHGILGDCSGSGEESTACRRRCRGQRIQREIGTRRRRQSAITRRSSGRCCPQRGGSQPDQHARGTLDDSGSSFAFLVYFFEFSTAKRRSTVQSSTR